MSFKFVAFFRTLAFALVALLNESPSQASDPPSGDSVIRAPAGSSEIVIATTSRVAGAIHSLTWNGKEFIDSFDHGRQLQSAANFDCGMNFFPEVFNPTEAGSVRDGAGARSTSQLLSLRAEGALLETKSQMAFWLAPGEKSLGHPALNDRVLSNHLLAKRVHIGHKNLPHAIEYDVTFTVPAGERHTFAQFEAVTGYMPAEFNRFWFFHPTTKKLEKLDKGPGEQRFPVVVATEDGKYAMGVYSPDQPSRGFEEAGYGRFLFPADRVSKWNCVFRVRNPHGVPAGDYRFRMFVVVGTLDDTRSTIDALSRP